MKILIVSSYLPYPLSSGGHIRLYNIIKNLSRNHQITLICEKRSYQNKKDIAEIGKFCKEIITVNRKKQWALKNIFRTGFSKYPFLITGHTNKNLKSQISNLLKNEKFHLIHVETFYIMQNLPEKILTPIVLTEHNIEYLVYKRFSDKAPFYLKPFLNIDILKLKKIEVQAWRKVDAVIAVSGEDKNVIQYQNNKVFVVPNGVDVTKFKVKSRKSEVKGRERTALFIGDFRWVENRDAARMILRVIWPAVNLKFKISNFKLKLWMVGKDIPESIKKLGIDGVIFDENAPSETSKIYEKADFLLAPIRIGGGTSFKILEAMASGVPVITTRLGAVGIGARDREEILTADNSQEFVDNIAEILNDKNLYGTVIKNSRRLIEEKYDWEKITDSLENVYKKVLSTNH